jgi:thymidylate kinase
MVAEKQRILKLRKKVLIIDRYLPCTLVFQGANGFPLAKGLAVAKLFELERPDRIFYLQLPWQVAFERKNKEARASDRHETDKSLYKRTAILYDELLEKKVLGKWQVVDATQAPEEEAECIMKIIRKDIKKNKF